MIDYSAIEAAGGFGKGEPRKIAKARRRQQLESADERENKKVRARSTGQCEVILYGRRCQHRAGQIHHHFGGSGVRGRGQSALATNKSYVCFACHSLITWNVLRHMSGQRYQARPQFKRKT